MSMTAVAPSSTLAPAALASDAQAVGNRISFENVSVAYKGQTVLADLNLEVHPGEFLALIGPSGSGKTTALRAVAGFVRPAAGRIRIGDVDVTDLPPYRRGIGMAVQNYALFPHMRIEDNIAFGLDAQGVSKAVRDERVRDALSIVGMSNFVGRYPRELSGGQQQRVAIARALAIRPRVLLLDEPLSALDAQIRHSMVAELARLHRDLPHLTVLYVTHDQSEALTLADRIAIMRGGKLAACGTSRDLYGQPPNRFTAEFLGRANVLSVSVVDHQQDATTVRYGTSILRVGASPNYPAGTDCLLCVRPHALAPLPKTGADAGVNRIDGTVEIQQWLGDSHAVVLRASGGESVRMTSAPMHETLGPNATLVVTFPPEAATLIPADGNDSLGH